jgi:hypothetical protein
MDEHCYKTWAEAAGLPETSARLNRLPQGLTFPDDFPEPIHFDAASKRLFYRGFMANASYCFLHALSADSGYVAALDQLYQASSYVLKPRSGFRRAWLWLALGATLLVAGALLWVRFH